MKSPIGIYQPFFKPALIERLDAGFTPLNWLSNPAPGLRELALHRYIASHEIYLKHELTGLVSPKFFSKTKLDAKSVHQWIADNPGRDVYLVNGAPFVPYANYNAIERNNINHSPILEQRLRLLCRDIGLSLPPRLPRQTHANLCCCSYWIASADFWKRWDREVISPIFEMIGKDRGELLASENYLAPAPVYRLTFLYERLIDHFIAQKQINSIYYRWNAKAVLSLNYHPTIRSYLEEMIPMVDRIDASGEWSEANKQWLRERYAAIRLGFGATETLSSDPADFDLPRFYPTRD
jgi:hypothetical protein